MAIMGNIQSYAHSYELPSYVDTFCPIKHFKTNSTCLMFFLSDANYYSASNYCYGFSELLVSLENLNKSTELIYHLNQFKLKSYKFKTGLVKSMSSKQKWHWHNLAQGQHEIDHLRWCENSEKTDTVSNKSENQQMRSYCGHLLFNKASGDWCMKAMLCAEETGFVCEWRPSHYRSLNGSLGDLLTSTFCTMCSIAGLNLLLMICLLVNFIKNAREHMVAYKKSFMDIYNPSDQMEPIMCGLKAE